MREKERLASALCMHCKLCINYASEALNFSAAMRLEHVSAEEREHLVEKLIEDLNLGK